MNGTIITRRDYILTIGRVPRAPNHIAVVAKSVDTLTRPHIPHFHRFIRTATDRVVIRTEAHRQHPTGMSRQCPNKICVFSIVD